MGLASMGLAYFTIWMRYAHVILEPTVGQLREKPLNENVHITIYNNSVSKHWGCSRPGRGPGARIRRDLTIWTRSGGVEVKTGGVYDMY
jgi:hypothetical protein